jgi:nucleotide-binding universal stress UspA family protein
VVPPLRVLVGVDFSPESQAAVRTARDLVKRTNGELTLAHVRPFSDVRAAVAEERGDLLRRPSGGLARDMAEHYEKRFERTVRRGTRESIRLLRGEPARELCREAGRGYDLLVMGTHGRGRTAAFLLGSTVQELLARSPIPILVVRRRRAP